MQQRERRQEIANRLLLGLAGRGFEGIAQVDLLDDRLVVRTEDRVAAQGVEQWKISHGAAVFDDFLALAVEKELPVAELQLPAKKRVQRRNDSGIALLGERLVDLQTCGGRRCLEGFEGFDDVWRNRPGGQGRSGCCRRLGGRVCPELPPGVDVSIPAATISRDIRSTPTSRRKNRLPRLVSFNKRSLGSVMRATFPGRLNGATEASSLPEYAGA